MNFYILRVCPNGEHDAKRDIEMFGYGRTDIGRIFIPSLTTSKIDYRGKKVFKEVQIVNGYIFAEFDMNVDLYFFLKKICGNFLSTDKMPKPLPRLEVQKFISMMTDCKKVSVVKKGQTIEVTTGIFAGFRGKVDLVGKEKVKVLIDMFGRLTPAEVALNDIAM